MNGPSVLVESRRGEIIESKHRGCIAVVKPTGERLARVGDTSVITPMRSSAKPFQALPVITEGVDTRFQFTIPELAVIVSSHSGEDMHVKHVAAILDKIGLDNSYLRCGVHVPLDWGAEILTADKRLDVLRNCCSGKHAGMLARCVVLGADLATYESLDSPVQQGIRKVIAGLVGISPESMPVGLDSCTAPVFGLSVNHIALAYARLVNPSGLPHSLKHACQKIVETMLAHPELIGGTRGRLCTDIMRACNGAVVAKCGAEAVFAVAVLPSSTYPDGLGIAIKIEDGGERAIGPVAVEILIQLGLLDKNQQKELSTWRRKQTRTFRGDVIGELASSFELPYITEGSPTVSAL